MDLLNFLSKQKVKILLEVFLGSMAGIFSSLFVLLINEHIASLIDQEVISNKNYLMCYLLLVFLYVLFNYLFSNRIIKKSQKKVYDFRNKITAKILDSEYLRFIKHRDKFINCLMQDSKIISEAILYVSQFISSLFVVFICLIYLLYIEYKFFLLLFIIILCALFLYIYSSKFVNRDISLGRKNEDVFLNYLDHSLSGFKELKINQAIYSGIFEKCNDALLNSKIFYTKGLSLLMLNRTFGQVVLNITLIISLTVYPIFVDIPVSKIIIIVFITIYILRPIEGMLNIYPQLVFANISAKNIIELDNLLVESAAKGNEIHINEDVKKIEVKNLRYDYNNTDENEFSLGPLNLTFDSGKIHFIIGGNGSGKSTFVNILVGLIPFQIGELLVNGKSVEDSSSYDYKESFSVVFSDFHLFERIYGVNDTQLKETNHLIQKFKLESKVSVKNGVYSTINLSTGQRKRLALITKILENKDIIVLDEWAADQDPFFKKIFYTEILQKLKEQNKIVIVITHDDQYFHVADRIIEFRDGITSIR